MTINNKAIIEIFDELSPKERRKWLLSCQVCSKPYEKVTEHEYKFACKHGENLRMCVG